MSRAACGTTSLATRLDEASAKHHPIPRRKAALSAILLPTAGSLRVPQPPRAYSQPGRAPIVGTRNLPVHQPLKHHRTVSRTKQMIRFTSDNVSPGSAAWHA